MQRRSLEPQFRLGPNSPSAAVSTSCAPGVQECFGEHREALSDDPRLLSPELKEISMTPLTQTTLDEAKDGSHLSTAESAHSKTAKTGLFSGRIGRLRFAAYFLLIGLISRALIGVLDGSEDGLVLILQLLLVVMATSVIVRRFHDIDRPGWMWIVMWVPLLNLFWFVYLLMRKGTEGDNRFGPQPS